MHVKTFFQRILLTAKGGYGSKKVQNPNFIELSTVIRFLHERTVPNWSPNFPQLIHGQLWVVMISGTKRRDTDESRTTFAAHFPSILIFSWP